MNTIKSKRILLILLTILLISISTTSLCVSPSELQGNTSGTMGTKAYDISNTIIGVMQVVGTAVAVIMLIWLAIKYLSAAPSEKADIKKSAVIYIVGAILLFGAVGILGWLQSTAKEVTGSSDSTSSSSRKNGGELQPDGTIVYPDGTKGGN